MFIHHTAESLVPPNSHTHPGRLCHNQGLALMHKLNLLLFMPKGIKKFSLLRIRERQRSAAPGEPPRSQGSGKQSVFQV